MVRIYINQQMLPIRVCVSLIVRFKVAENINDGIKFKSVAQYKPYSLSKI